MRCWVDEMLDWWNVVTKYHHIEMSCRWNIQMIKCQFFEMSGWWNVRSLKCHINEMSFFWNVMWNVMSVKCHVGEMSCQWNVMSMKCHVNEMLGWWNNKIRPVRVGAFYLRNFNFPNPRAKIIKHFFSAHYKWPK
jgi:hypothetical protein